MKKISNNDSFTHMCYPGLLENSKNIISKHFHGQNCGHMPIRHYDHIDYIVKNILHFPHLDHCDSHGPIILLSDDNDDAHVDINNPSKNYSY